MKQLLLVLLHLHWGYVAFALNECSRCECCDGGASRCQTYDSVSDYCLDGCLDGLYGNRCLHKCMNNCLTCSHAQTCTKCSDGYYGSNCDKCQDKCLTCTNRYSCTACIDGYYSANCIECRDNCLTCSAWDKCGSCKDGFYNGRLYDDNFNQMYSNCHLKCQRNCKSCTSYYNCVECIDGKFNDNFKDCRESCSYPCKSCTSLKTCTACYPGKYGTSCQSLCEIGCQNQQCDIYSGNCTCMSNFQGDKCEHCINGKSGTYCNDPCPSGCSGNSCTRDGNCYKCKLGFTGSKCNICESGKYGENCDTQCSVGCANTGCQRSGNCYNGLCKQGFIGNKCDQCVPGKYDVNCDRNCPQTCYQCVSKSDCSVCKSGYYGNICSSSCPTNCKLQTCSKTDGKCNECEDGYYGEYCTEKCHENCQSAICRKYSGTCINCIEGYFGDFCNEKCPFRCNVCSSKIYCSSCEYGYKGQYCQNECFNCKLETPCGQYNGICEECEDGYFSVSCTIQCSTNCKSCYRYRGWDCIQCKDGKYGQNKHNGQLYLSCHSDCPNKCLNKTCRFDTGHCDQGCVDGYWGNRCSANCPNNCKNGQCFWNNGTCVSGCIEDYSGDNCSCPLNCDCDLNGQCVQCKNEFQNIARGCACSKKFCSDERCSVCSNPSYYVDNSTCCRCRNNCKNNECTSLTKCSRGCEEGYYKDDCSAKCEASEPLCSQCTTINNRYGKCVKCLPGFFPSNITNRCVTCPNTCSEGICDTRTGKCSSGCITGRWGDNCNTLCDDKCHQCSQFDGKCLVCKGEKYSLDCKKSCSDNCNRTKDGIICAIENGACMKGCNTYTKHGAYCNKTCSIGCISQTCGWKTGECLNGCVKNYYGKQCDKTCSVNCVAESGMRRCNSSTGNCAGNCKNGFFGNFCDRNCSDKCVNATCSKENGHCLYGCVDGYDGANCLQALGQKDTDEGGNIVIIGAAAGTTSLVLLVIAGIGMTVLLKRRRRKSSTDKKDAKQKNEDNNATFVYSEINDDVIQTDQPDAVYAMPNKKRKNIEEDKISKESKTANRVSDPNNETPITNKDDIVKQNNRKPHISTNPVYDNTAVRGSVARTHTLTGHSDDLALEIEEDLDNIRASSQTKSVTLVEGSLSTESEVADTYYNVTAVKRRKINLDHLPEFVSKKTKIDFVEEFQLLPPGLIKPYVDSQRRQNLSKNRYKGIYPYDETRVLLKEGDTDYINASYIDGYNKRKAYIASIGPTYKYMGDMSAFWVMVWQEKVGKIVMLTKLDEGGAPKCDQYWPEKDFSLLYAYIQVTCQSEESYADYTVRSFTLQKDSEKRKIVQVHFTAWPDKGVPDDVTSLIEFRQKVISTKTELEGPILVHCSAGIGRTGTYIALDSLTEEGEAEGEVDIYAFVRNMREQRVNMVQTAEQYQYLHNALVHTLTFDSKSVEASKFEKYMTAHTDDHLGEKFEKLQASVEQRSDDEVDAVKRNQALRNKNRVGADIPGDRNRPKLYLERKLGSSDYVNAVYINSYTTINRYLVAQTPLPDTVVDFLTLLVQEKVSCIVNMETDSVDDKTIGAFYPADNQTLKKGTFTVKSKREKDTEQYVLRKLEIAHKGKSGTEDVTIPHIQFTHWNEHKNIPEEPAKFVQFVKDVEMKYGGIKSRGPILVHCLTGAEKSGLFCVVSNLLEKTQIDQETSVVNAVRQIKYRRHMSVPNKDQYIFCHQCVNEYLRTFDIYSNFELKT